MLECRAQPIRFEIPDANLAVCRTSDDRVEAGRSSGCAHAIDGADDVDKGNGFNALAARVTTQGRDDFALAQGDGLGAAVCAGAGGDGRGMVDGERSGATEVRRRFWSV